MGKRMDARWVVVVMAAAALSAAVTGLVLRRGPAPAAEGAGKGGGGTDAELAAARAELARTRAMLAPFEREAQDRFGSAGAEGLARVADQLAKIPLGGGEAAATSAVRTPPEALRRSDPNAAPSNTLRLAEHTVTPVAGGLKTTLRFTPTGDQPLDQVVLMVRVPRGAGGKLSTIAAVQSSAMTNVIQRVGEDGSFALFMGSPVAVQPLDFELTVNAPTKVRIGGSCGIEPFDLDIGTAAGEAPAP